MSLDPLTSPLEWVTDMAAANGYGGVKLFDGGTRYGVVAKFVYTGAILTGTVGDPDYQDRWCYDNVLAAAAALEVWDGEGDPIGWHRHPRTGRRVSQHPDERDASGRPVGAVGVQYVRL